MLRRYVGELEPEDPSELDATEELSTSFARSSSIVFR